MGDTPTMLMGGVRNKMANLRAVRMAPANAAPWPKASVEIGHL